MERKGYLVNSVYSNYLVMVGRFIYCVIGTDTLVALGERLADQEVQRPGPAPAGHFDEEEATMSFPLFWCCLHQDYLTMKLKIIDPWCVLIMWELLLLNPDDGSFLFELNLRSWLI